MNDLFDDNCGEWDAITRAYRVVGIVEGMKRYYYSAGSSRATEKMKELLEKGIPAWIEERNIQDELDDVPF